MITLGVADLVVIAGSTLGLDTGEVLDLLDAAAAERALAQVLEDGDPVDLAHPAALLLCALIQGQPLRRGNQQVALAAVLQFLALNGLEIDPDPPEAVVAVMAGIAAGALGAADAEDLLASRMLPADLREARVKEEPMRARPALPLAGRIRKATARTRKGARQQPVGRFQRFTDRARRAVLLATDEARRLRHPHVGTEHLLLGLISEEEGLAARALESLGLNLADVRQQVLEIARQGEHTPPSHIPFTPQAKKVLELSLREALILGHTYVGTEHLLLALLRAERGIGAQVLTGLGASDDRVRERLVDLLEQREQAGQEAKHAGRTAPADLADAVEQLAQVRALKEAALDGEDFEAAKALRDREKDLLTAKMRLERLLDLASRPRDIQAVVVENQQLRRDNERLRGVLRDHGIEPDGGTARPA